MDLEAVEPHMLSWEPYFDRFVSLNMDLELARDAMRGFAESSEALDTYADHALDDTVRRRFLGEE